MTLQNFRYVAIVEASSWLLLIVATIVKYGADGPDLAPILGPIHGLLFVAYILMALTLRTAAGWDAKTTLVVLAGSIVPFGGYFVERKLVPAT